MPHTEPVSSLYFDEYTNQPQINPEVIRRKQKSIFVYRVFGTAFLVSIPVAINVLSRFQTHQWEAPTMVSILGLVCLAFYRAQAKLSHDVEAACHQLGPGVKLRRKFSKSSEEMYQIFQEGHRYYYIRSLETGEKRLVPKEKVLEDYDLAL